MIKQIGHYSVLEPLGSGGMGEVYLALDTKLQRKVAIKLLSSRESEDARGLERFTREAKAVSSLNHPNILTVHEIGELEDHTPYLVTELVSGRSLKEIMDSGPMDPATAVDIAAQAAGGLAKAHSAGVVHRDIKPANLMLTQDGFVKILDFGLAKLVGAEGHLHDQGSDQELTVSGAIVGTPAYLSCEQLQSKEVDARSDLFSLGVVLYQMLSGRNPFLKESLAETLSAILNESPPRLRDIAPGVSPELSAIVERALAKNPEDRFQTAPQMSGALRQVQSGILKEDVYPTAVHGWSVSRKAAWAAGTAGLLLGLWLVISVVNNATNTVPSGTWASRKDSRPASDYQTSPTPSAGDGAATAGDGDASLAAVTAPSSLEAYTSYMRGEDLFLEREWEAALGELQLAVAIDPGLAMAWSTLSLAFSCTGDDIRARAAHLKATEVMDALNDRERGWVELEGIWVTTANGNLFLERVQEYLAEYPDNPRSYLYAGMAVERLQHDPQGALEWFQKARDLSPVYYPAVRSAADCLVQLGQTTQAMDLVQSYLGQSAVGSQAREKAVRYLQTLQDRS